VTPARPGLPGCELIGAPRQAVRQGIWSELVMQTTASKFVT